MTAKDEDRDTVQTSAFNPFPQPQTIPSGWDLSGLLSTPQPAPMVDEEDTAEG